MNNYDYPCGSDTATAPWNETEAICPECRGNRFETNISNPALAGERCIDCPVEECPICSSTDLDQDRATCRDCGEEWER